MDPRYYTVDEIKDMLHLSSRTILNYIRSNKLKAMKLGGKWLIEESDLKKFLQDASNKTATK